MITVRFVFGLALALAFLTPGASGASASGDLTVGSLRFGPAATLESPGLSYSYAGVEVPVLDIEATRIDLQRIGVGKIRNAEPVSFSYNSESIDERASYSQARLRLELGEGDQFIAFRSLGTASGKVADAVARGVSAALAGAAIGYEDTCFKGDTLYCIDEYGVYEIIPPESTLSISGELTLLLHGPTLLVNGEGKETVWDSGTSASQQAGSVSQVSDTWIVLHAAMAGGVIEALQPRIYASAPTFHSDSVEFFNADGALRVGAVDYRASDDDVIAAGDVILTPAPVEAGQELSTDGAPIYASSFATRVSGDIRSIDLEGTIAFLDSPVEQAGFAALVAGVVALVAYGWQHLAFAAAALYTRLNKPDILENDVRSNIFDIIRLNPGISAREVHRRSSQSWGTVVYHLRQLERHHLVVSRTLGRTRNYYENHGKYRGMEVQLACLQSDRARTLARAIALQPGITQEALATASGFPQPTTSYYVRKLKQAGLVEEQRNGRYVKYVPHGDLPRFIEMSDAHATLGASSASGVQA